MSEQVYGIVAEEYALPTGITLTLPAFPGQNALTIKLLSGGTFSIVSAAAASGYGSTFVTLNRYLLGPTEIINIDSSGPTVVLATGATCVFSVLRGKSSNI